MLNQKGIRELAYIVTIDDIEPIIGSDNCECAIVNGWHIMVQKNEFKKGDVGIYFEIDSYLDSTNPAFSFMEKKKYKVKTQRYTFGGKGNFISQGLLMSAEQFGWHVVPKCEPLYHTPYIVDNESHDHHTENETRFLTAKLGVTYNDPTDNIRKAPSADKYKKMAARHPELFKKAPIRWLMRRSWGKKFLFLLFGRKKDKGGWPQWVTKTDEERIENLPFLFKEDTHWIATEKIDGTSTTFTIKRGRRKNDFYVCSRNVVMDTPDRKNYYSEVSKNVYWEMADNYDIEKVLNYLLDEYPEADWITIQGETYGTGIQKRTYSLEGHDFAAFNLIMSHTGRWNSIKMADKLSKFAIPTVPIVKEDYQLPATLDELREFVDSDTSVIDKGMREGIVFRSLDGTRSFKCVSPTYLLKYHG